MTPHPGPDEPDVEAEAEAALTVRPQLRADDAEELLFTLTAQPSAADDDKTPHGETSKGEVSEGEVSEGEVSEGEVSEGDAD